MKKGGFINLKKLYEEEPLSFLIPDLQYFKKGNWIPNSLTPYAIFVSKFERYLTPQPGKFTANIRVKPGDANYLTENRDIKNFIKLPEFTNSYNGNSGACIRPKIESPYSPKAPKICVVSRGNIKRDLKPSVFTEWQIKITDMKPKVQYQKNTKKVIAAVSYAL